MSYYLGAGSTRHDGRRYVRGDELPAELGRTLTERGLATDDRASLSRDLRPTVAPATEPKIEQHSTLAGSQTVATDDAGNPVDDDSGGEGDTAAEKEPAARPAGTVTVNEAQKTPTTPRKAR